MSILRRALAVTAGVTALTLGLALPALAHVTVNPKTAEKGGFTKVAFRVPNERDDASTTKVEVELPTDHPLAFVSVRPVPGWDVKVTEGKIDPPVQTKYGEISEAVTKIIWSGGKVEPGQFQEFEVSMGFMPDNVDQLVFPATQTYSSGEVVKWADEPKADGSEAEHPAPTLKLVAPTGDDTHGAAAPSPAAEHSAAPSVVPVADTSTAAPAAASDGTARLIGGIGIAVGIAGVAVAVLALRRRPAA
ncbi:YcnI family copper-binding membrane protein [Acrocarpospora catenulata]|uniref:YcnI family copper-binding membrane protein n=1 Tax=Acrocarpospora catenulata TaxID=2836182 RepID=UPI001BDB1FAC|nr:YcnI family protein [Acrocarpospora catenulata]